MKIDKDLFQGDHFYQNQGDGSKFLENIFTGSQLNVQWMKFGD